MKRINDRRRAEAEAAGVDPNDKNAVDAFHLAKITAIIQHSRTT